VKQTRTFTTFANQRGLSIRGGVGKGLFSNQRLDSQVRFPNYINSFRDDYGVLPGIALYKDFNSKIFNSTTAENFLLATAYVDGTLGNMCMQLGHNQCFVGMVSAPFIIRFRHALFFAQKSIPDLETSLSKHFAEMEADDFYSVDGKSQPIAKKYMAAHFLDLSPIHICRWVMF
jgi:hypothetical protein